ncbi:MAG: hypothetical protein NTY35_15330 [Planctomycetota bacterium]|nr:hypothetical protein [Planctomycetota bacterium]
MRFPLLTAALLAGAPLGLAAAQSPSIQNPVKNPPVKGPPVKPIVNPTPQPFVYSLAGSDNCATAAVNDAITGPGTFAINTTAATSGTPIGSCGLMVNDVWFYWTANISGVARVSTCAGVAADTVIAVWADGIPAGNCPTTQITCLDDFCGLQTQVSFPVTAGSKYFLELGGFNSATYSGTFDITVTPPAINDECTAPIVISGAGPHAFDNSAASTGTTGQAEASCLFFGSTAINNDVWYRWTSGFTGTARVSTCGSTVDTKIAAYAGAGCPSSAALGCNDDACGLQTRMDFPVVTGGVYLIQLGLYPFSTVGGSGSFTINPFVPPTNDTCTTPQNVVGNGPHNYDTTLATTGTQGQSEPLCLAFGSTALYNDAWFTWTATATGLFDLNLCGGSTYDTRLAVYNGGGCPTGAAIACNDDLCGLVSGVCFSATAGQVYTIQIGAYGTTGSGTGTFVFTLQGAPPTGCQALDDGSSEDLIRNIGGGTLIWLNSFGTIGQNTTVSGVEASFGSVLYAGNYVPSGPVTIAAWEDPNDDGNPNDAVLLGQMSTTIAPGSLDTDVLQSILLSSSVTATGKFFVGASVQHTPNEFPAPVDYASTSCGGASGSPWFVGNTAPTADLTNLLNNSAPPQSLQSIGINGNWLLRPICGPVVVGTPYCFGDGTGAACPCANNGAAGNGCANSVNANGGNLSATGSAVVGADTLALVGSGMPNTATALYFQGTAQLNVPFGDGLRCVGGTVIRLGTKTNAGGASQYPVGADPLVSVRGLVPSGATRNYQAWYRNAAAFCTASTFNLTNGLQIVWQ